MSNSRPQTPPDPAREQVRDASLGSPLDHGPPLDHGSGARPWSPSLLVRGSFLLHAAALPIVALRPSWRRKILPLVLADHVALTLAGAFPRSSLLGPSLVRQPPGSARDGETVALTFDDGPDPEVTPRIAELLARHGARATFFCIGRRAEAHPEIVRDLVAAGHRIENHTFHHSHTFSITLYPGLVREIGRAQAVLTELAGRAPRLFRAPAGVRNPFLDPVLARLGLHLAAWTRRGFDTIDGDAGRVVARLVRGLSARDVLLLHDGNGALGAGGPVAIEATRRILELLDRRGLRAVPMVAP